MIVPEIEQVCAEVGLDKERLSAGLALAAEPERAPQRAAQLLRAAAEVDAPRLRALAAAAGDRVATMLGVICGTAPFFVPFFLRNPVELLDLCEDDHANPRPKDEFGVRLATRIAASDREGETATLRRFKYYELARITVRECTSALVPPERSGETLAELSHLADVLLSRGLETASARIEGSLGPPLWTASDGTRIRLGFCVLALGKLGSEELNYSSDVDLVYVFAAPAGSANSLSDGPENLSPAEYFTRLAQELTRIMVTTTAEGFLYRVDLDLRPEGKQGPLVVSGEALVSYYEAWAAAWEKAAFMKARPVAGDEVLGWRTIRAAAPMIYRSNMDFTGVAAIKEMKAKIEKAKGRVGGPFNVKLGRGGIRDVEFVAQALQMLHGGKIPQVRGRSTQRAIVSLREVGVLPEADAEALLEAYHFLRRVENRLQMEAERQVHELPVDAQGLRRLARSMGFAEDPAASFERSLERHRQQVRQVVSALFEEGGSEGILAMFARNVPDLLANPASRPMIENLARQFARVIESSADPERAMNNLDRFIHGVGGQRSYYGLLLDRPELVPRLASLFAASEYFSGYFATHPQLIEPIFSDPNVLLLTRADLVRAWKQIRSDLAGRGDRSETEVDLDALRQFHNRELVNVGLLDLAGKVSRTEAEHALTEIAEVCMEGALALAQRETERRAAELPESVRSGQFLVVAMGKLASWEITYGSDLDVIFLYDVEGAPPEDRLQAQEYYVRLAQRLIWALRTRTSEGVCYEIDARLRPSGNQGMLVTSRAAFARYHRGDAQVWERQALLRARRVAGDGRLGEWFETHRLEILRRPLPTDARKEIHRVRIRMEAELAQEDTRRHDFKTGRGGLHDIESVVQYLQLANGTEHAELLRVAPTETQLDRLERLGLLEAADAQVLRDGWRFLQLLSSRLRIVENRSISDLDEERGDLDALALRLGYGPSKREGGPRRALLEDYRRHTGAIREVYTRMLGVNP